jgi:hypothetical protein
LLCEQNLAVKLNVHMLAARVLNLVQFYLNRVRVLTLKGVSGPLRDELQELRVLHG